VREALGWILCGLGVVCSLRVMAISGAQRQQMRSGALPRFESEYEHHRRLRNVPGYQALVFVGVALSLMGMYLIGMFG
jgi:hypothetical protein